MMPGPAIGAVLERAAARLAAEPALAEAEARRVMAVAPNDPRARLIVGSARRRLGDPKSARAILEPLARAYPRAANTQYELGVTLYALGEVAPAIAALRRATAINRELSEAWRALGEALFREGDLAGADGAFAQHERASVLDPALKPAAMAIFENRPADAERMLRVHITTYPEDKLAIRMLADLFQRQKRFGDAEILFARCLELDPGFDGARFGYANALFQQQRGAEALPHAERLLATDPSDAVYRNLLAGCLGLVGENDRAGEIYRDLLQVYDKQPRIWLNYGHTLRTVGQGPAAADAYRRSIALAPGLGDAYWSLANLKLAAFSEGDEAAILAQLGRVDLSADDRLHLHYALGKALEDRREYEASFDHYRQGARLRRAETGYDPAELTDRVRRSINLYTEEMISECSEAGSSAPDPIFILGLPRAGSTLIEQILASHSAVEGTMELPDIGLIAARLGQPYPERVGAMDAARLAALGDGFLAATRIHRKLGRPYFIDKMPNNFLHVGLINLILPKAKIIDARRHPMGSCFSAFKQHFAQGQNFSYDLTDLGLYYRDYVALMAHFDAVLPGRVHRVIYEDTVEDTESEVRRLLDYCGLPFEEGCLRFYENDRAVRTVSSEQVRRPIFRQGLEQWKHYEPWLDPLKAALGPVLENWRG